jgi:hypothetical protein
MKGLLIIGISLLLMAHKCDKPKPPKAQALAAVEEAWWSAEVAAALELQGEVSVAILDDDGESLVVVFTRADRDVWAHVAVAGDGYRFRVAPDGYVDEPLVREIDTGHGEPWQLASD